MTGLGTVVDTSAGFVTAGSWAFDLAIQGGEIYFNHPQVTNGGSVVEEGRIEKIDPSTSARSLVVGGLDNPSGLAFDAAGNLYFGNVTTGPVRIELRRRAPDGTITSLGTVVDTSAGFVTAGSWGFDVAAHAGEVFFNHPEVTSGGSIVEAGRIEKIDPATLARTVVVPAIGGSPSGIALDGAGKLFFGEVTHGPVQIEMGESVGGAVNSLGRVVDTSAGFIAAGAWAFDVEIAPAQDTTPEPPEPPPEPADDPQRGCGAGCLVAVLIALVGLFLILLWMLGLS